jgi:transposase
VVPKLERKPKIKIINGKKYAYDMKSFWDKEQKKYRKKSIYLGRVKDEENSIIEKKQASQEDPSLILTYGDTYSIHTCVKQSMYSDIFKALMPGHNDTLMGLVCYKLLNTSAMRHAQTWTRGNYASLLYKNAGLSSQQISAFLKKLGKEKIWRDFFKSYIKKIAVGKTGIVIDSTGLPNEINFPLSAWGCHGGEAERETRLVMAIEGNTGMPLYFRYMAGNIVDVSSLSNTIKELKAMGINMSFALIDAGYYSEANIAELYSNNISFLTRLPANRTLFKKLIDEHSEDMERAGNIVIYGKRALYIKQVQVDLFSHVGYAYIICDIKRKADETTKFLMGAKEDGLSEAEINCALKAKGKFVLISSSDIPTADVIPLYYTRQAAENLFGISKSYLDILPLRTHSVETFRGYLMLTFISLITYIEYKRKLCGKYTVEEALMEMSNLMCRVYGNDILISEPNKKMKEIISLIEYGG